MWKRQQKRGTECGGEGEQSKEIRLLHIVTVIHSYTQLYIFRFCLNIQLSGNMKSVYHELF